MDFKSTRTVESVSIPGVKFVVRVMSEGVRVALRLKMASELATMREISLERDEWLEEIQQEKDKPFDKIRIGDLTRRERARLDGFNERIAALNEAVIDPQYFSAGLVSVEGITIDGSAPNAENLRELGPPSLYREILAAIRQESGLSAEELENLGSPSISGAVVEAETSATTADSAGANDGTPAGPVASTSQE